MKLVQSIYNEITGKTETISKRLKRAHEIWVADITQLDIKINQLCEQYNIVSKNCSVVIYHIDDCKEQFSSFERFNFYDSSSMSPCENIRLEYNFLILLPNTKQPQNYSIKIHLSSRVGINKKSQSEHGTPRRFFRVMSSSVTGHIEVEYIDYTVARNFMVTIQDWYSSISKNKTPKFFTFLQDYSEHFPFIFQLTTIITLMWSFHIKAESFISAAPSLNSLFSGAITAFGTIYLSALFALRMGYIFEEAIDSYQPISFININRGDAVAIREFQSSNKKYLLKLFFSLAGAVFINVLSSYITILMGILP